MNRLYFFRRGTLALLLLLLCQGGYYLYTFNQQQRQFAQGTQKGRTLSLDIPLLPIYQGLNGVLSSASLWNMEPPPAAAPATTAGRVARQHDDLRYAVKRFNGIQALYQVNQQDNRWEFYGVISKSAATRAIFYNPSFGPEGWRTVEAGDSLTEGLVVSNIAAKQVELKQVDVPDGTTWILAVFALPAVQP